MIDQNSQFFAILTNVGAAKLANANALGIPWSLTALGVGDGNGTDPIPDSSQTRLINEWRRAPLNQLKIDPINPAVIVAEQIIPADVGGKWIREIGLYDADGDLVAVANCAPSFKPSLSQGSGRTQIVRMNLIVSSTGNVVLKIDPAVVLATRDQVDSAVEVGVRDRAPIESVGNLRGYVNYSRDTALTAADFGMYVVARTTNMVLSLPDPRLHPPGMRIVIQVSAAATFATVTTPIGIFGGSNGSAVGSSALQLAAGVSSEFISTAEGWQALGGSGMAMLLPAGFIKHSNGMIEQWVAGGTDAQGTMTVSLPIQFTVGLLGGMAGEAHPSGWARNETTVWGFDMANSTLSVVVARGRTVTAGGAGVAAGISGRIRVWGR